ncbi:MAG: sensor histidine kinase [Deltaproteobacteria bacterium]|nr:sensor histidine kinase [Deltaproteobacteria bacterium]
MHHGPTPEDSAVESVLVNWRHTVANIFLPVSAIVYLPAIVLLVTGQGPPLGGLVRVAVAGCYLTLLSFALWRRIEFRARAWVILACGYALAILMGVSIPHGSFARALPIALPIFTIVLLGSREGWAATAFSAAALFFVPFFHTGQVLPAVLNASTGPPIPSRLAWTQAAAMLALLFAPVILLNRFLQFLMQSLGRLERETRERAAAYRKLEYEMQERRRLEHEVIRVGDEERRRLGNDIHDGVCQKLTGALLRCEALKRRLGLGENLAVGELSMLSSLIEESIDEAHTVAQGLGPLDSDPAALATALGLLIKRTGEASGISCRFETTGNVNVPESSTAQHLYRIAQEAVSNAARHAHAGRIAVTLRGGEDVLLLEVEDDGDGVPDGTSAVGMGFRTMAYRASLLDGELTVSPAPAGGTRVSCQVPRGNLARLEKQREVSKEASHG